MVQEQKIMSPEKMASLPEIENAVGSVNVQNIKNITSEISNLSLGTNNDPTVSLKIDAATETDVSIKLTDLPKKCMEKVLRKLDFVDLVHVADTNKSLKEHAAAIFKTKYFSTIPCPTASKIENWSDELFLYAINVFGTKISKITIEFKVSNQEHNAIMLKTVMEKCGSHLRHLNISQIPSGLALDQTFANVRTLVFSNIHNDVHKSWSSLNKHFPNLQTLELLEANGIIKNAQFKAHIPKLERIVCSIQPSASCIIEAKKLAKFLNKNSHITDLHLKEIGNNESNMEFVKLIDWDELKVTKLTIDGSKVKLGKSVRFKYLHSMTTNNFDELDYRYMKRTVKELHYTIDQLEYNSFSFILQFLCLRIFRLTLTASKLKYSDMEMFANNLALLSDISVLVTTCKEDAHGVDGPQAMQKFIGNTLTANLCRRLETIKFEYPLAFLKSDIPELKLHVDMYRRIRNISGWKFRYYMREQSFEQKGYHHTLGVIFTRP